MTHSTVAPSIQLSQLTCAVPHQHSDCIQMAHGGGGRLTQRLLEQVFFPAFENPLLAQGHDGAMFESDAGRLAFTTDAHVVRPLFFPGGNIGALSVHGTVNDLLVCGAVPWLMSAAFILEEGFALETLQRIVSAMKEAATRSKIQIVTGDTKVVDRGKGDGVFINTAAIGKIHPKVRILPQRAQEGDQVLISGPIAAHGIAVLSAREKFKRLSCVESTVLPGFCADKMHYAIWCYMNI